MTKEFVLETIVSRMGFDCMVNDYICIRCARLLCGQFEMYFFFLMTIITKEEKKIGEQKKKKITKKYATTTNEITFSDSNEL